MATETDPENKTTTYAYDGANRVTSVTNALSETTSYGYDSAGRQNSVTFANGSSRSTTYNVLGQVTATSGGPDGGKSFTYDNMNRLKTVTDANSRVKENFYDALGRLTKTEDELDKATNYSYDIAGRRLSMTDANSNVTSYEYDDDSRLTKTTYPAVSGQPANEESYSYNGNGQLSSKTTPNGDVIGYTYNAAGLLASEAGVSYSYDSAGAITSDGVQSYVYDDFGRRTSATSLTTGKTLTYTTDKRGLRTSMDVAGLMTVGYTYDNAMRLKTVQKDSDTAATYNYDSGGRRTSLVLPNGVTTSYGYDSNDRITSITTQDSSSNTLASFSYTLDSVGMPTATTKQLQVYDTQTQTWSLKSLAIAYTFDNAYRLTSEVRTENQTETYREEFTYDDVGNRTQRVKNGVTTTNTYNARNQLATSVTNSVTTTYTYDNNGNMLTSSDGSTTKTMVYDTLNRMTSWSDGTNSEATAYVGARWHRASYTPNGGSPVHFLYDGDNVVADLVDDPVNPGSYLGSQLYVTPFLDQNLSVTDISVPASPVTRYYSQDRRNSVSTLTTTAGAMSNVYDYTAMGEKLGYTHETAAQRYQYTGREFNGVSGEHYFRYRTYSPSTGMFFTRDPLGYVDGPSLYAGYYAQWSRADAMGLGVFTQELVGPWRPVKDATINVWKRLWLTGELKETKVRVGNTLFGMPKYKTKFEQVSAKADFAIFTKEYTKVNLKIIGPSALDRYPIKEAQDGDLTFWLIREGFRPPFITNQKTGIACMKKIIFAQKCCRTRGTRNRITSNTSISTETSWRYVELPIFGKTRGVVLDRDTGGESVPIFCDVGNQERKLELVAKLMNVVGESLCNGWDVNGDGKAEFPASSKASGEFESLKKNVGIQSWP